MDNAKATVATIPVKDQNRADTFYKEILGFKASDKNMPGGTVLVGPGGTEVFLYETESSVGDATRLSLAVTEFEEVAKELNSKDVNFESIDGMPGETDQKGVYQFDTAKTAWFKDSEGSTLNIFSV